MNIKQIPIYFINRNRLESLKKFISWLTREGFTNIKVIDNQSTYPPLIDYYSSLGNSVEVIRLDKNIGPWVLWQLGMHKEIKSNYIVSDSDLYPSDFCPSDLIGYMHNILSQHREILKVAPGLNLENISPNYSPGELACEWESQFWHKPVGRCLFAAGVDTTFAMYRFGEDFSNDSSKNLRLGYPYLMEHSPWHVNDSNLSDEEIFYRKNTERGFSYWSANKPDERLMSSEYIKNKPTKKILHLGGGNEYIPGWVNMDISGRKLDLNFDLNNCKSEKIPFDDNTVDGFYMSHVFEHISDTLSLMSELYRIGKNGAKLFIRLPHGSSNDAWEDPTHVRAYFECSFVYFSQPAYSRADYGYTADWQVKKIYLIVGNELLKYDIQEIHNLLRSNRNIVNEMLVELEVIKPARPRSLELLKNGEIIYTSNSLIHPNF